MPDSLRNIHDKRGKISKRNLLVVFTLITSLLLTYVSPLTSVYAQDLSSPSYKLIDPSINTGGGDANANSGTYKALISVGDLSSNPQLTSASYKLSGGISNTFTANVPKISCFETSTNGSSLCTTAPSYVQTGGMVRVCGTPGCYDRARFEIDSQSNPSDTLYSIQISEDSGFTNYYYVSGTTGKLIVPSLKSLNDFKTKTQWETPLFNVIDLKPNTNYWIRTTALHGDFTESDPSTAVTAKTSTLTLNLDIDIAGTTGTPTSTPPHKIDLNLRASFLTKSNNLIWLNTSSNSRNGIMISESGQYGGLYDGSSLQIASATTDLFSASKGMGLQHYQSSQWYDSGNTAGQGAGELAVLNPINIFTQNYDGATENVGVIAKSPSLQNVYQATGPVYNGKAGLYIVAKPNNEVLAGNDSEVITFILTANY